MKSIKINLVYTLQWNVEHILNSVLAEHYWHKKMAIKMIREKGTRIIYGIYYFWYLYKDRKISENMHYMLEVKVFVTQSCPTLCNPVDCGPPDSSVHRIFQARIMEWVAILFCRGSSQSRDQTHISCIAGGFLFTIWATREARTTC